MTKCKDRGTGIQDQSKIRYFHENMNTIDIITHLKTVLVPVQCYS